jgi:hypothetical protein
MKQNTKNNSINLLFLVYYSDICLLICGMLLCQKIVQIVIVFYLHTHQHKFKERLSLFMTNLFDFVHFCHKVKRPTLLDSLVELVSNPHLVSRAGN